MSTPEEQLNILHKISNTLEDIKNTSEKTLGQAENQNHKLEKIPKNKIKLEGVEMIKGDKGDKGDKGESGKDGKDGKNGIDGKQGKDGLKGDDGKDGKDGKQGKQGAKGDKGNDGKIGKDGKDGLDGKDGSPDTPFEIKEKLESLDGEYRLDAKAIKNFPAMGGSSYNERRGSGGAGHTIQNAGTALATEKNLNFNAPLTATDDPSNSQTDIAIPASTIFVDGYMSASQATNLNNLVTSFANNQIRSFGMTIDGQGGVISTGIKGDMVVPFTGTITSWTLLGDQSGSITIDTWKDTYANFPPTVLDTMWGTKPNITTATKGQTTGLSIAVTAGDIIRVNVDSVTSLTRCLLVFTATAT